MRTASRIIVVTSLFVLAVAFVWESHCRQYWHSFDPIEAFEIRLVSDVYRTFGSQGLPVNTQINGPSLLDVWPSSSSSLNKDSFTKLILDPERGILDSHGTLLHIYHFDQDANQALEPDLEILRTRFVFAVWSAGENGKNEYGAGDDIFRGISTEGELELHPSDWVRLKRDGLIFSRLFDNHGTRAR